MLYALLYIHKLVIFAVVKINAPPMCMTQYQCWCCTSNVCQGNRQVDYRYRAKYEPIENKYVSFLLNRNNITWSHVFLFKVSSRDLKLFRFADAKSQTFQYELKHFSLNRLLPIVMVFIYI